jgi:hypothetical protein
MVISSFIYILATAFLFTGSILGFNKDNIPDYFYLIGTTLFLIKSLIHFYDKIQNEKEVTRRSVLISQYDSIGDF